MDLIYGAILYFIVNNYRLDNSINLKMYKGMHKAIPFIKKVIFPKGEIPDSGVLFDHKGNNIIPDNLIDSYNELNKSKVQSRWQSLDNKCATSFKDLFDLSDHRLKDLSESIIDDFKYSMIDALADEGMLNSDDASSEFILKAYHNLISSAYLTTTVGLAIRVLFKGGITSEVPLTFLEPSKNRTAIEAEFIKNVEEQLNSPINSMMSYIEYWWSFPFISYKDFRNKYIYKHDTHTKMVSRIASVFTIVLEEKYLLLQCLYGEYSDLKVTKEKDWWINLFSSKINSNLSNISYIRNFF